MRMAFGLVSLLVVLAIVMFIADKVEIPAAQTAHDVMPQVQQLSGHDADGNRAMDSFTSEEFDNGGHFAGIKIDTVLPGGAYETFYGIKPGDIVYTIGDMDVTTLGDFGSAQGLLQQAYQESKTLGITRDGTKMTLPVGGVGKIPGAGMGLPGVGQ